MASGTIPKNADGTDSGWIEYKGVSGDSKSFIGSIYYRKIGSIVFARAYGLKAKTEVAASSYIELMQLPVGYRPKDSIGSAAMTNTGVSIDRVFPALISGGGTIFVYTNADGPITTLTNINFNFVFTVD